MLTREQIRVANDRPREWVPTPDWTPEGETYDPKIHGVWVGILSGKQKDEAEILLFSRKTPNEEKNAANVRGVMVARSAQNEDGSRMFADADADWLGDKSARPLTDIANAAFRLNRMRAQDQDELTKN